jgi:hypothetical protein
MKPAPPAGTPQNGTRNGSSLALLSVMLKAVPALKACAA